MESLFGKLRVSFKLYADEIFVLAFLSHHLQHAIDWFEVTCDVAFLFLNDSKVCEGPESRLCLLLDETFLMDLQKMPETKKII